MIKVYPSARIFTIPALSMFLLLIPLIGFLFTALVCIWWYFKYQDMIHSYFTGVPYEIDEISDEELMKGK